MRPRADTAGMTMTLRRAAPGGPGAIDLGAPTPTTAGTAEVTATRTGPADRFDAPTRRASRIGRITRGLPPEVAAARARVLETARANTENVDVKAVRAKLEPDLEILANHFAANRPSDEPKRLQGTWKSLWYDDPDLDRGPKFLPLDRSNIFQVVEDGYYWNVANNDVRLFGRDVGTVQGFLKGEYTIKNPPTEANRGERRLNVIDLEFTENRTRLGALPRDVDLRALANDVGSREKWSIPTPGPIGVKGELWNLYLDDNLRVSAGVRKDEPGTLDLYILERVRTPSG
jgi:hypothetical protein